ncbi:MAG: ribulose bisphosphate carboxylase small subunit [Gammaproteobacteria bacterium]|nr:MAG: ribulose bisphosphate carboxylase small subunit [Gammaproteobacteria bacterium]
MQDYQSSLSDPASRKFETFSYLPAFNSDQIRKQIEYIVSKGWNPGIEHTEPENANGHFWYMWKLPMFGETDVDVILKEVEACHAAHPNNHVRLLGFDNYSQSAGASMVIFRGKTV